MIHLLLALIVKSYICRPLENNNWLTNSKEGMRPSLISDLFDCSDGSIGFVGDGVS